MDLGLKRIFLDKRLKVRMLVKDSIVGFAKEYLTARSILILLGIWVLKNLAGAVHNAYFSPLSRFPALRFGWSDWYKAYIEVFCGIGWTEQLKILHEKYGIASIYSLLSYDTDVLKAQSSESDPKR